VWRCQPAACKTSSQEDCQFVSVPLYQRGFPYSCLHMLVCPECLEHLSQESMETAAAAAAAASSGYAGARKHSPKRPTKVKHLKAEQVQIDYASCMPDLSYGLDTFCRTWYCHVKPFHRSVNLDSCCSCCAQKASAREPSLGITLYAAVLN
jgi:hypothetical protein